MLIRTELFSLPPLAIMIAVTADRRPHPCRDRRRSTVMAPLHILTHYGNGSMTTFSPGEIAGFRFIANHLAPAKSTAAFRAWVS